jgi:trk system potassium uptake protein
MQRLRKLDLHPAQIVALSFLGVILIGTLLLSLPAAVRNGERLAVVDAFFTATSATCVTGLVVHDTGARFSTFGQLVILTCIQIGGLGLMSFTTIFLVLSEKRLGIADRMVIQQSFHHGEGASIRSLLAYIVTVTLVIEGIGALMLSSYWYSIGRFQAFGEALYHGIFHSVSAFCNAGFSLYTLNAVEFQRDPFVMTVISLLIVMGGLGFLVGWDLRNYANRAVTRLVKHRRWFPGTVPPPRPRLSLHSRIVMITTLALLLVGMVSYYVLEREGVFRGMDDGTAWLNAFFASATARTAGFNAVDYGQMGGAALLCTMVLMFIGASPGSTGGGIKTSTFALLVTYGIMRWRGRGRVHVFRRTVPQEARDRAEAVTVAAVALVILGGSALMAAESRGMTAEQSQAVLLPVAFETVSAFGTVGLSMGHTLNLTFAGKWVIMVLMFLGRIGPMTLAYAVSQREKRESFRYAEENIMIG